LGLALALLASAQISASATSQPGTSQQIHRPAAPPALRTHSAPQFIRDRVNELGRAFNGRVGIAVRSVDDG
jgi:hypothetical protein